MRPNVESAPPAVKTQFRSFLDQNSCPKRLFLINCFDVQFGHQGRRSAPALRTGSRRGGGQIQAGVYRPGERIPSVRKLRDQHQVSLTTALEAVRVLADRGLVQARPQSGYFVREPHEPKLGEPDPSSPPRRPSRVERSLALQLNLGIGNPQEPTLGAAVQGPELMPISAINALMSQVLRHQPSACHSYDAPPGTPALRRVVARRGSDTGYSVSPDDIVITSGAKEAVYLSITRRDPAR